MSYLPNNWNMRIAVRVQGEDSWWLWVGGSSNQYGRVEIQGVVFNTVFGIQRIPHSDKAAEWRNVYPQVNRIVNMSMVVEVVVGIEVKDDEAKGV